MRRKWTVLLAVALAGLLVLSVSGGADEDISVTVKVKNSTCSELQVSQFLFVKDEEPLSLKHFTPPRTIDRNRLSEFSFVLSGKPSLLILRGKRNGEKFTDHLRLNWGTNQKETSCGELTVEIPYKGGIKYPVARFQWSPENPEPGEEVRLDAKRSIGEIAAYGWDLNGDGKVDRWQGDPVIFNQWENAGKHRVSLTIRDKSGRKAQNTEAIEVSAAQSPEPSGLPHVESLSCRQHGYFSKSVHQEGLLQGSEKPPHENCWGYYKAHIYPLEKHFDSPVRLSKITASCSGGISELRSMKSGFKLQVLRSEGSQWETLKKFSAPCASGGPGTLVQWKAGDGNYPRAIGIRVTAPPGGNRLFIDNSSLWIEYYKVQKG